MPGEVTTIDRMEMGLAALLEQTARAIYDKRGPQDIHPGQWSALRFFGRANRKARTVAGLSKYLGVTRGPASRAAAALVRQGLILAEEDLADRRSAIFTVTKVGHEALKNDPIRRLALAISELDNDKKQGLAASLEKLYGSLNA